MMFKYYINKLMIMKDSKTLETLILIICYKMIID